MIAIWVVLSGHSLYENWQTETHAAGEFFQECGLMLSVPQCCSELFSERLSRDISCS